jgi:hypothetical protein
MKNSFLDNSQLELNKNTYQLRNQNNLIQAFFPSGSIEILLKKRINHKPYSWLIKLVVYWDKYWYFA